MTIENDNRRQLNKLIQDANWHLIYLFPAISHLSTKEIRTRDLHMSEGEYRTCLQLYRRRDPSNIPNQLASFCTDIDFEESLKDPLHILTSEQKSDYLNRIKELIDKLQNLIRRLGDCTYYTQNFNITTNDHDVPDFFYIIVWLDDMSSWSVELLEILYSCLPSKPVTQPFTETKVTGNPETSEKSSNNIEITDEQKKQHVRLILNPLSGLSPSKQPIMNQADYKRLIEYTDHLVLTDSLPRTIQQLAQTGISNEHIRYTFYRLHKELFGSRPKKRVFIDFLHAVFCQFQGTQPSTTNSKFSTPPKSYEKDFKGYIGEAS